MRVCLIGCLFLVFGCGNDAGAGGDAGIDDGGQLPDADICDSVECECDTDDDCGAHEVCDTSSGPGRVCVCAPAYEDNGSGCAFAGAPLAPGFDDPAPWTTSGGAVLDATATGSDDPGEVTWSGEAICDGSGVSQTFAMPPYGRAEPLAFEITHRNNRESSDARPQIGIKEAWSRLPRRFEFFTQSICLGEAGFGGDVEFRIEGHSVFCPSSETSDELIVDRFEVVRAEDVGLECPDPGFVLDGDFDGDGTAWTPLVNASVQDGVGQNGTRAARLQTATLCSAAFMTGVASLPVSTSMPNQALRFFWNGTTGRVLQVRAADGVVADLTASDQATVSIVCLPPYTQGLARDVTFALPFTQAGTDQLCSDPDIRDFVVDTVEVVSEAECGDDPYLLDGDFELAATDTVPGGWRLGGADTRGPRCGSPPMRSVFSFLRARRWSSQSPMQRAGRRSSTSTNSTTIQGQRSSHSRATDLCPMSPLDSSRKRCAWTPPSRRNPWSWVSRCYGTVPAAPHPRKRRSSTTSGSRPTLPVRANEARLR
ncbi:MAG: hypothetical protein JRG70_20040 [Deltaproteobacteria bacterium]|nr:hypothetical protein [Deltaproteobacteria bacterium]